MKIHSHCLCTIAALLIAGTASAQDVPLDQMSFFFNGTSYELRAVNPAASGFLNIPDIYNDGSHGEKPVTVIGHNACYQRTNLTGLRLPASLTSIENEAFFGCSNLTSSLTIPDGVTSIGISAFRDCGFTGSLTIPDGVTSIDDLAFYNCSGFDGSLTLPANLQTIGTYAFGDCSGFTGSLTIPDSVTSLNDRIFWGCNGFDGTLTLPAELETIGYATFYRCNGLTSLTLPAGLTSIGDYAFYQCSGLEEVCWLGAPPISYGITPFGLTSATHLVPWQHLAAYQALDGLSGAQVKFILEPSFSGNTPHISFFAESGYTYQPQHSDDLIDWTNQGNAITGDNSVKSYDAPTTDTHGYFRLSRQ